MAAPRLPKNGGCGGNGPPTRKTPSSNQSHTHPLHFSCVPITFSLFVFFLLACKLQNQLPAPTAAPSPPSLWQREPDQSSKELGTERAAAWALGSGFDLTASFPILPAALFGPQSASLQTTTITAAPCKFLAQPTCKYIQLFRPPLSQLTTHQTIRFGSSRCAEQCASSMANANQRRAPKENPNKLSADATELASRQQLLPNPATQAALFQLQTRTVDEKGRNQKEKRTASAARTATHSALARDFARMAAWSRTQTNPPNKKQRANGSHMGIHADGPTEKEEGTRMRKKTCLNPEAAIPTLPPWPPPLQESLRQFPPALPDTRTHFDGIDLLRSRPDAANRAKLQRMRPLTDDLQEDCCMGKLPTRFNVVETMGKWIKMTAQSVRNARDHIHHRQQRQETQETDRDATAVRESQLQSVTTARQLLPNVTTLLHCLLQRGVQSTTIKEAAGAAATNQKRWETDDKPLHESLRMLKAATSQIIILVASGFDAQVGWADLPRPFDSFQEMVEVAGGLQHIMLVDPATANDLRTGEQTYKERLAASSQRHEKQDQALWTAVRKQCEDLGIQIPRHPTRPLTGTKRRDFSDRDEIRNLLQGSKTGNTRQHTSAPFCGHKLELLYPWTDVHPNDHNPVLTAPSGQSAEPVAFTRMAKAAATTLAIWESIGLGMLIEASEQEKATVRSVQTAAARNFNASSIQHLHHCLCIFWEGPQGGWERARNCAERRKQCRRQFLKGSRILTAGLTNGGNEQLTNQANERFQMRRNATVWWGQPGKPLQAASFATVGGKAVTTGWHCPTALRRQQPAPGTQDMSAQLRAAKTSGPRSTSAAPSATKAGKPRAEGPPKTAPLPTNFLRPTPIQSVCVAVADAVKIADEAARKQADFLAGWNTAEATAARRKAARRRLLLAQARSARPAALPRPPPLAGPHVQRARSACQLLQLSSLHTGIHLSIITWHIMYHTALAWAAAALEVMPLTQHTGDLHNLRVHIEQKPEGTRGNAVAHDDNAY